MIGQKTHTFLKGGHSPSELWFMLSLGSASVWKTPAVLSLYMGYRHTPDASQNRTVPSSCLQEEEHGSERSLANRLHNVRLALEFRDRTEMASYTI